MSRQSAWVNAVRYRRSILVPPSKPDHTERDRLAAAILNVGIGELDQCTREIVRGEDEAATTLAELILESMATLR